MRFCSRAGAFAASALFCAVALLGGCAVDETGEPPPSDALYYPVGVAAHPDGRYLYIVNGVFDRKYNEGTLTVLDTYERRLLDGATQRVGLFGGELLVARRSGESAVEAFTVTRDDNRLFTFEITADAATPDGTGHFGCGGRRCGVPYDSFGGDGFSGDPYGLAFDGVNLLISHLERGVVSRWERGGGVGSLVFGCAVNLTNGASSLARHPVLGWAYVTDRFGQQIQVVEPVALVEQALTGAVNRDTCRFQGQSGITVDPFTNRGRTRGLGFSADGTLLYVASNTDSSLRIYDTSIDSNGRPRNDLVAAVPIGNAPNVVRVAGLRGDEVRVPDDLDRGLVGDVVDAKGQGLVYLTAFDDDRVMVVDPTTRTVIARVDVGLAPHDIAFMPDVDGNLRGFVSNFQEHTVSVIDLEPGSPRRFQVLATVP